MMTFYLICGILVVFMAYEELEENKITGDQLLSRFPEQMRNWFANHLFIYRLSIVLTGLAIVFIWPYVIFKNMYDNLE